MARINTIGTGHSTKYFYSHAEQEDLNKLFGYQVGYAARYKKNMVVDANGQISISYLDPQGRVIATGLAGANSTNDPNITNTNLFSLDSEVANAIPLTIDALNKQLPTDFDTPIDNNHRLSTGNINSQNDALLLNQNIDNQSEGENISFEYRVKSGLFQDDCLPAGVEIPFSYDLDIHLMNDCGEELMADITKGSVGGTPAPLTGSLTFVDDDIDGINSNFVYNWNSQSLPVGVYSLSKKLVVDQEMFQVHLETYLAENTCLLTKNDDFFFNNVECDTVIPHDTLGLYDPLSGTTCFTSEALMLMDISPDGQYGSRDSTDVASVFNDNSNALNGGYPTAGTDWRNPATPYLDQNGDPAMIEITNQNGIYTPRINFTPSSPVPATFYVQPEQLLYLSDFLDEWENEWAKSLLTYHPEYKYFEFMDPMCSETTTITTGISLSSMEYDQELQSIQTYDEAVAAWGFDLLSGTTIKDIDPFFVIAYPNVADNVFKHHIINTVMADYKGEGLNLLDYCLKMMACGNDLSGTCTPPTLAFFASNATTAQKDLLWNTYKSVYLAEKQRIVQIFLDVYTIAENAYNGFIDSNYPTMPGLSSYTYYPGLIVHPSGGADINGLYAGAIIHANSVLGNFIPTLPWFLGPEASAFQDKTRRFTPIDDLYDATIPEIDMALGMAAEIENDIYLETGRCKLSFDLELFLGELVEKDYLPVSGLSSNELFTLTGDLYTAMGGTLPGTVDVNAIAVGNDITISATGATHSIALNGICSL